MSLTFIKHFYFSCLCLTRWKQNFLRLFIKYSIWVSIKQHKPSNVNIAMLGISIGMHIDTENGKSLKRSYEISNRDEEAKMCIFSFIFDRNVGIVLRYCTIIMHHTYSKNVHVLSYNVDVIHFAAVMKVLTHV